MLTRWFGIWFWFSNEGIVLVIAPKKPLPEIHPFRTVDFLIFSVRILLSTLSFNFHHPLSVGTLLWHMGTYFCFRWYSGDCLSENFTKDALDFLIFASRGLLPPLSFCWSALSWVLVHWLVIWVRVTNKGIFVVIVSTNVCKIFPPFGLLVF